MLMEKCMALEAWPCRLENTKATNPAASTLRSCRKQRNEVLPENPTPTLRLVVHAEIKKKGGHER
jgi:hypothetical protein